MAESALRQQPHSQNELARHRKLAHDPLGQLEGFLSRGLLTAGCSSLTMGTVSLAWDVIHEVFWRWAEWNQVTMNLGDLRPLLVEKSDCINWQKVCSNGACWHRDVPEARPTLPRT